MQEDQLFCTKLIHEIMGCRRKDVLATYLNLQQCAKLTLETFLEHTLLNLIGEMARQVFTASTQICSERIRSTATRTPP